MNKYFAVFKTSFKQESKTITNSITSTISFFIIIFVFNELWGYIYGGSGVGTLINGYSLQTMLWYMVGAEVLMYAFNARHLTNDYGNDIKSGKIAYILNKPYSYYGYKIASTTGAFCWRLLFLIPASALIGFLIIGPIQNFSIAYVLPIIFTILFGTFINTIIYGTVGLLSFWIEESTPFSWIIQKFNMLFGLFFPPEFFPGWIQNIINYSPIFATVSGPSKLIANFSWELFAKVTASQLAYAIVFLIIGGIVYKLGTKKVTSNGG